MCVLLCVLYNIAEELGHNYSTGYYHTDAVFFLSQDLVPDLPENLYYFRNIRIALEHENDFSSGLFKELSHLMILDCDLRVLVTYFNNYDEKKKNEMDRLLKIVSGSDKANQFSEDESILLILATRSDTQTVNIFWEGYIFKDNIWKQIGKEFFGHLPKQ